MTTSKFEAKNSRKPNDPAKAGRDNRANQLNPNNQAYWSSRGVKHR